MTYTPPELLPDDSPGHPMAPWFADLRAERAVARAEARARMQGRPRPSRAVVTIVHDEPVFLPIWLSYYGRFFEARDIYVLDHESAPENLPAGDYVRMPVSHETCDHVWMLETIQDLQHELLERYEVVLVVDVDEFVAPHPRLGDLGAYLDGFAEPWVNCLGYEILHQRTQEPPLRLDRPILAQRSRWFANNAYSKPALTTTPMQWRPGFHSRSDLQSRFDPDLRLIHLHRVDYDICLARHQARSTMRRGDRDDRRGWASHNWIVEEQEFQRWFEQDSCFPNIAIELEDIPPAWQAVL